jgi:hypothetical protein
MEAFSTAPERGREQNEDGEELEAPEQHTEAEQQF